MSAQSLPDSSRHKPPCHSIIYQRPEPGVLRAIAESLDHPEVELASDRDPTLWLYRDRTVALLRRYMRISMEVGRMPSIVGREFFRTRVTSYHSHSFVDAVIFVLDIEHSLERLPPLAKTLIGMIVLQEYNQEEAAAVLGRCRRTVNQAYGESLDLVTEIFLERRILEPLPVQESIREKSCQGGSEVEIAVTCSCETE